MKRSNSWKNLQKTFASTPITVTKRAKVSRRTKVIQNNFIRSIDDRNDFQIEDSDEENSPSATPSRTPLTRNSCRRLAKPLLINTSLNTTFNSSVSNNSIALNSESDDSLPAEPELRDVSECPPTRTCKARSKSLLFLSFSTKNQQHSQDSIISQDLSTKKKPSQIETPERSTTMTNPRFASNKSQVDDLDSTIVESDSSNERDSPEKFRFSASKRKTLSSQISFSQTSESQTPVIESESTQLSLKFDTPTVQVPVRRTKSRKLIKGGLVEHLNKVLNSTRSEFSFWMNERTSDLVPAGFKMRIDKMEQSFGRILLHCIIVDQCNKSNVVNILCVDPAFKKLPMLQVGQIIEVELDCHGYSTAKNTRFYPQVSKILV